MTIRYEKKERIVLITIDRPQAMNALDGEAWARLNQAWIDFRDDPEVWVAVITGAGDKAFCAGADLKRLAEYYRSMTPLQRRMKSETEPGLGGITRNLEIFKPIIAAINGYCLAGGLELALACDLRIASENASFGLTEVSRGIIPGAGGTQRLPRLIPLAKALEMILTAERIDALEAWRVGLVNRVVPAGELLPEAMTIAQKICRNAPLAVQAAKEAIYRGLEMPLAEGLRLEQFLAEPVRQSEDAREGPKAFAEKRSPRFKGK
ncbi:MAG: enoyl-CoA hydratase/isomerase family protein [Proteobacteria bacterium]|nr:enoyl-CoA hydratase/isomerase family protein [Pseudomonadota bacterium]MBU1742789.1 enoyl-CoA hydratase/isomerase family protein [Pseudomonadota bacterium]